MLRPVVEVNKMIEFVSAEVDFYNQNAIFSLTEDDALSTEEEGFMMGYLCS